MQGLKVYQTQDANNEFASLIKQDLDQRSATESAIINGIISRIDEKIILVDVGLKSEGIIQKSELSIDEVENLKIGQSLEVYVERLESKQGEVILSRDKAKRIKSWNRIKVAFDKQTKVTGVIRSVVKGGFACEIFGIQAFIPSSQLSDAQIKNPSEYLNKPLEFLIIKIDTVRMNVIASRRAILEQSKNQSKDEVLSKYKVGDIVKGKIKAIQSYGAFVSIETIDCLLHTSEISHIKVTSPEDLFSIGEGGIENKFKVGEVYDGKVTKLTDWGVFIDLSDGVVGLIHSSEIKHLHKNINPKTVFKVGDTLKAKLKELDIEKKKINLSYKDTLPNPIDEFKNKYPIGTVLDAKIINKKEFGLFLNAGDNEIDIFVHYKQLDYSESSEAINKFKKGDTIKIKIIDIQDDKVNGSIRALLEDPFDIFKNKKKNDIVTCKIAEIMDNFLKVNIGEKRFQVVIKKNELAIEKQDQRTNRFAVGDAIDAIITDLDHKNRKVSLSVKKLEEMQQIEIIKKYKNVDSGAALADILGPALKAEKMEKKKTSKKKETKEKSE